MPIPTVPTGRNATTSESIADGLLGVLPVLTWQPVISYVVPARTTWIAIALPAVARVTKDPPTAWTLMTRAIAGPKLGTARMRISEFPQTAYELDVSQCVLSISALCKCASVYFRLAQLLSCSSSFMEAKCPSSCELC